MGSDSCQFHFTYVRIEQHTFGWEGIGPDPCIVGGLSLVAYVYEEEGGRYVVLRTAGALTAISTHERDLELETEIQARSHLVESPEHERRRIAGQLESTRELDRGRERRASHGEFT
jgi:hypothetical protein